MHDDYSFCVRELHRMLACSLSATRGGPKRNKLQLSISLLLLLLLVLMI